MNPPCMLSNNKSSMNSIRENTMKGATGTMVDEMCKSFVEALQMLKYDMTPDNLVA